MADSHVGYLSMSLPDSTVANNSVWYFEKANPF